MQDLTIMVSRHGSAVNLRLTPALSDLLDSNNQNSVEIIRSNKKLLNEVREKIDDIKAAAFQPAGAEGVRRAISRRLPVFRPISLDEKQSAIWWANYIEALGDLPEAVIDGALSLYVRQPKGQNFPTPGHILELTPHVGTVAARAATRAMAALREAPREIPASQRVSATEIDELQQALGSNDKGSGRAYGLLGRPTDPDAARAYDRALRMVIDRERWPPTAKIPLASLPEPGTCESAHTAFLARRRAIAEIPESAAPMGIPPETNDSGLTRSMAEAMGMNWREADDPPPIGRPGE